MHFTALGLGTMLAIPIANLYQVNEITICYRETVDNDCKYLTFQQYDIVSIIMKFIN